MKHFNLGNVWGRVTGVKEETAETGTPYLAIEVQCPNDLYGNVMAYGRLWGKKTDRTRLDDFLSHYKDNPARPVRFKGFFSQYTKGEKTYSNYTFTSWSTTADTEFRASFVLTGEVTGISTVGDEKIIHLYLLREGKGEYKDIEENFVFYAFNPQDLHGIEDGDVIQCAGFLRSREPEDEFGRQSGMILPYAMEIKQKTEKDAS